MNADVAQQIDATKEAISTTLLLSHNGDWWDFWMILSLTAGAIATAAVVVFTLGSISVHKREAAAASAELERYKSETERKVADARQAGITAGETAGNALVRAANLEKEAQELKAANLALEKEIQPRRLTGEDSKKLAAALSKLKPIPIGVVSRLFDSEGTDFADDLAIAFNNGHWQAVRQKDWTMNDKGVEIATLEGTSIPPALAKELLSALTSVSIEAKVTTILTSQQNTTSAHFQPGILYLVVGAKP